MTMTRQEVRKQVRSGWLTRRVAALLLGFDLDMSKLDTAIEHFAVTAKIIDGEQRLNASDLLSFADKDLNQILDGCLPIDRQKRSVRRNSWRPLTTQTARDAFQLCWNRIYRHIMQLVATDEEDLTSGELKLIFQVLGAARYYNRFDLTFTDQKLMKVTGLDSRGIYRRRRRSLERRGVLHLNAGRHNDPEA